MNLQHKNLSLDKWGELNLMEQLANVGSEVIRATNWLEKGNPDYSQKAFARALELLNLTKCDSKNKERLKELSRLYEVLVDYFIGINEYGSTKDLIVNDFMAYTHAAAVRRKI